MLPKAQLPQGNDLCMETASLSEEAEEISIGQEVAVKKLCDKMFLACFQQSGSTIIASKGASDVHVVASIIHCC